MKSMRVLSKPRREPRGPSHPPWWRTCWLRSGTVVQYEGVTWELIVTGAADQMWRAGIRVPTPTTGAE